MFESKEEIKSTVDRLFDAVRALGRGDVLTWEAIEKETGLLKDSGSCKYIVQKLRKRVLRERRIAMRPVVGVGLKLLTHQDQVRVCAEDRHRRMFRQSSAATRELSALDPSTLGLVDRRLRMTQLEQLKTERQVMRRAIKEVLTVRKSQVNPVRKPLPATPDAQS